jgi:Acetyltransferases, including N-acetylases of ribosomal proteins
MLELEEIRKKAEAIALVNAAPDHAPLLYAMFTGKNTRRYSPVAGTSIEALAERLALSGKKFTEEAPFYRFFGKIDHSVFGTFVLKNIDWNEREAEIGFCLLDEWQGRGFGSALVLKCVNKVFAEADINRLWATVSEPNKACRKLMQRIGFVDNGFYMESFIVNGKPTPQILYTLDKDQLHYQ